MRKILNLGLNLYQEVCVPQRLERQEMHSVNLATIRSSANFRSTKKYMRLK